MIPFFLTVDTEGDNIWDRPSQITSRNTESLYRFQELCEKYNIKPIYLTNYEAAINERYQKFIKKHMENLEIALHLHAWNSPPLFELTDNDYKYQPYLHEYPDDIIIDKLNYMINLLENIFQTKIVSHRGGRYSINEIILETLYKNGIKIDCSIVPGIDWTNSKGDPDKDGGPNFKNSIANIHILPQGLIEIPVSTYRVNKYFSSINDKNLLKRLISKFFQYRTSVLRSKLDNIKELKKIVYWNIQHNASHLEYIIHSSELVMNESSLITSMAEEEIFYNNLELFFIFLKEQNINSYTFREYLHNQENL